MPQLASGRHVGFTTDPLFDWIRDASPDETLRLLATGFSEEDLLSILFLVEYGEADLEPPSEANPRLGKPQMTQLTIRRVLDGEGDWTEADRESLAHWLQQPRTRGLLQNIRADAMERLAKKPMPEALKGILEPGDD